VCCLGGEELLGQRGKTISLSHLCKLIHEPGVHLLSLLDGSLKVLVLLLELLNLQPLAFARGLGRATVP
jgi:hypothetical protein